MDLEKYLQENVIFHQTPEDTEIIVKQLFGKDIYNEWNELFEKRMYANQHRDFYEFIQKTGLYQLTIGFEKFDVTECMKYISEQIRCVSKILDAGIGGGIKLAWYAMNNSETQFTSVDFTENFVDATVERLRKYSVQIHIS